MQNISIPQKHENFLYQLLIISLAGFFFLYIYSISKRFLIPYGGLDRVEDNILYYAIKLSQGETIYGDPTKGPLDFVGYAPVFFYMLFPLIKIFGVKIWLGRAISIAASLLIGRRIFIITNEKTNNFQVSIISALLFFVFYSITKQQYDVGRMDVIYSWFIIESLYYASHFDRNRVNKLLIIILSIVIFYTKQPGLYITFGCFIYFLIKDRKFAFFYLLCVLGIGTLIFFLFQFQSDGWFYFWLFEGRVDDHFSVFLGIERLLRYMLYPSIIFGIIIYYYYNLLRIDKKKLFEFWHVMSVLTILSCLPSIMIPPGDVNNLIPVPMVTCVMFGIAINKYKELVSKKINYSSWMALLWCTLLFQMVLLAYNPKVPNKYDYQNIEILTDYVKNCNGEIYVDRNPSLAFLNNKKVYDDSALIHGRNKMGKWQPDRLINLFKSKHFELVFSRLHYEPDTLKKAIMNNYVIIDKINSQLGNLSYPYNILAPKTEEIE